MVKDCISKRKCITCNRQHHSSIHQQQNPNSTRNLSSPQQLSSKRPHNSVNRQRKRFAHSLLLYVPITIRNKHKYSNTSGFLDNGSNENYLPQSISGSLQLYESLEAEEFFVNGFQDSKQIKARSVELTIRPFGILSEKFLVKRAYVFDKLNLEDVQPDKLNIICSRHGHLKDINFPDFDNNQVSVLIGNNNIDLATTQAKIKNQKMHHVQFSLLLVGQLVVQQPTYLGIQFSGPTLLTTETSTKTHTFPNY